jgi:glycosyltransferase involved in cell wall biosynthesis
LNNLTITEGKYTLRAAVYLYNTIPLKNATIGYHLRIYSNIRAYLDLGFEVEVVHFYTNRAQTVSYEPTLAGVRWTPIAVSPTPAPRLRRLAGLLGVTMPAMLDYRYPAWRTIQAEIQRRRAQDPDMIHHFEYLHAAAPLAVSADVRSVFSALDIESDYSRGVQQIRKENQVKTSRLQPLLQRNLSRIERAALRNSRLVVCIADHERDFMRDQWGIQHAHFLAMSIPDEAQAPRTRAWGEGGKLRLFHIGKVDNLPSYSSLKFLLTEVFPLLSPAALARIEMRIVGKVTDAAQAQTVVNWAKPYPQVQFDGFQADSLPYYGSCDLQVVGSTYATGLRTRIVESFAYGLPVLSTNIGAAGVDGARDGENILLAADAAAFARRLTECAEHPERLAQIAANARDTYDRLYSRRAVAAALRDLLIGGGLLTSGDFPV